MNKPNKQTIVPGRCVASLMATLPLSRLRGFGGKLGQALARDFNIKVAGDIITVGEAALSAKYDRSQCAWMLQAARGEVDDSVTPRTLPNIISCGKTYRGATGLPLSGIHDGTVWKWLVDLSAELLERLDDAREEYGRIAKTVGVGFNIQQDTSFKSIPTSTAAVSSIQRSNGSPSRDNASAVSLSKNGPLPRQSTSDSLANLFVKMMMSALEKSNRGPKGSVSDGDYWKIVSIFIHATSFDTIASDKQKISSFFSTRPDPCLGHKKGGNERNDAGVDDSIVCEGLTSLLPPRHSTTSAATIMTDDTMTLNPLDGQTVKERCEESSTFSDGNSAIDKLCYNPPDMSKGIHHDEDIPPSPSISHHSGGVNPMVESKYKVENDLENDIHDVGDTKGVSLSSIPNEYAKDMSPSQIAQASSCRGRESSGGVCSSGSSSSNNGNSDGGSSCKGINSDGRVAMIDMEVLRELPLDMQRELISHYQLDNSLLQQVEDDKIMSSLEVVSRRDHSSVTYEDGKRVSEACKRRRLLDGGNEGSPPNKDSLMR